jgi:hypothetical protein
MDGTPSIRGPFNLQPLIPPRLFFSTAPPFLNRPTGCVQNRSSALIAVRRLWGHHHVAAAE